MKPTINSTVLAISGNYAVVKLESRKYPGVLIQGDTFHELIEDLAEVSRCSLSTGEQKEIVGNMLNQLKQIMVTYEQALIDNNYSKPY